jgi:hypothetical protein
MAYSAQSNLPGKLRRALFGISEDEASFDRRGFTAVSAQTRAHLERCGGHFVRGYLHVLEAGVDAIASGVAQVEPWLAGFFVEGAGMAAILLDGVLPSSRPHFARLLASQGARHVYMIHVGAGWGLARLPWPVSWKKRALCRLDPMLRWLAMDGWGFHAGFFGWASATAVRAKFGLDGYHARAFDQGLGRSMWFVFGGDVERIARHIDGFQDRAGDLWSGVGLASAYAGGVERAALVRLAELASHHRAHLAQGAAFAAKARKLALNPTAHTNLACEIFCGKSADHCAAATHRALADCGSDAGDGAAYDEWRTRIRATLSESRSAHV